MAANGEWGVACLGTDDPGGYVLACSGMGDVAQVVLRIPETANTQCLLDAWQQLVKAAPRLGARLGSGNIAYVDAGGGSTPVERLDWTTLTDEPSRSARLAQFLAADRERGFPVIGQSLLRFYLIHWQGREQRLIVSLHSDLLDGRRLRELLISWLELSSGGQVPVPAAMPGRASAVPDPDHEQFWSVYLDGYRAPDRLALPGGEATAADGLLEQRLTAAQSRDARTFRKNAGVTLNTMARAAWALLLGHYLDHPDIVFGVSDPGDAQLPPAGSMPRPLRVTLSETLSVGQLLRDVRTATRRLRDHPWHPAFAPNDETLFDSCLEFHWRDPETRLARAAGAAGVGVPELYLPVRGGLTLEVSDEPEILLRLRYQGSRFDAAAAKQILRHYLALLLNMSYQPGARALAVPYLTEFESRPVLWPGMTVVPRNPDTGSLASRFMTQAARTPERIAVAVGEQTLSYAELEHASTELALRLRRAGVAIGSRVGLCVERDLALPVGILGILKAGAAYVPLDPAYPRERLDLIIEDAELDVVVAPPALQDRIASERARCISPVLEASEPTPVGEVDLELPGPQDLAYLIYTSGSTGRPKGVMVTHHNALRLFDACRGWLSPGPDDVWTLFHSFAFDFSVWEIWGALLHGGRLEIVPETVARDPEAFYALLVERRVSVLSQTPSAFLQLIKVDALRQLPLPSLRFVIFGGEALDLTSLRGWMARHGERNPVLVNMYGITETTVHVTYRPLSREDVARAEGSLIGYPLPDLYIRLLGRAGRPVPPGVPGEICVGGAGVARGYLKRPELNQQRFVADHLSGNNDARLYRSGDFARRVPSGELAYLGRQDDQVKIRGFRIDLGEITSTLRCLPGVRDGVVVAREGSEGVKRLIAYYVPDAGMTPTADEVRKQLADSLPAHMLPALLIAVDRIPLTHNHKADTRALPEPGESGVRTLLPEEQPRGDTERRLAAIWSELLERQDVGRQDDFFALGGDSLLALQVVAAARRAGLALEPRQLFAKSSLATLAAALGPVPSSAAESATDEVVTDFATAAGAGQGGALAEVPVTPMQRWYLARGCEHPNQRNQAFLFRTPAMLDPEALEAAVAVVVERHQALHYAIRKSDAQGWVMTRLAVPAAIKVSLVELEHLNAEQRDEAVALIARELRDSLDIGRGPLVHVAYFSGRDADGGRLLIAVHHLLADSLSWRIFMRDLETAYRALLSGEPPVFGGPAAGFVDWAGELQQRATSLDRDAAKARWQPLTQGAVGALWPEHLALPSAEPIRRARMRLPAEASRILIAQDTPHRGAGTEDCLLTALALAAARHWPEAQAMGLDLKRHGRPGAAALGNSIGQFSNLHPFVLNLRSGAAIAEVIDDIAARLHAIPEQGIEWGLLDDPTPSPSQSRLLFSYRNGAGLISGTDLFPMLEAAADSARAPETPSSHALEIHLGVDGECLAIEMLGDPQRLSPAEFEALADAYRTALLQVADARRLAGESIHRLTEFPRVAMSRSELACLPFTPERIETILPLAPIQRLYHTAASIESDTGFEQWVFQIDGELDCEAFEAAWRQLLNRHAVLRSVFVDSGQREPRQLILAPGEWHLQSLDWRGNSPASQQSKLDSWLESDRQRGFDLARGPLTRVTLMRLGEASWQLVWSYHLIQIDGWSWPLLLQELGELYDAARDGRPARLPAAGDYGDYLDWLKRRDLDDYARFWGTQLRGMATADGRLPVTRPAGEVQRLRLELTESLSRDLERVARQWQATPNLVFQAAWALLLSSWSGAPRPVFGAVFSGRTAGIEQAEQLVGPLVNNLPVRVTVNAEASLPDWIADLRAHYADLNHYQNAAPSELLAWAGLPPGRRLFESLLVYQNVSTQAAGAAWGRSLQVRPLRAGVTSHYPLTLVITPGPRYRLDLLAQPDGPGAEVLEALASQFTAILSRMLRGNAATLHELLETAAWSFSGLMASQPADSRKPESADAGRATPPRNSLEVQIAAVCREVLEHAEIGCEQNFFDLGAQSLSLLEIHSRLQATLDQIFPIVTLFQYPTVSALARHLGGEAADSTTHDATRRGAAQRAAMRKRRDRSLHQNG